MVTIKDSALLGFGVGFLRKSGEFAAWLASIDRKSYLLARHCTTPLFHQKSCRLRVA
ncbi:hypothetical protein [Helicobacter zhangjianzhongii]|uniref:Uncharacterized protein n=1 Tax=Helicobacter zhangjianzhongii TaxID=2974574 RepID=A0ACC6FPI0_9HELI|nr:MULTISPECIES: hypothetical protein [unclassified Helicobacter]MDL0079106.1 hypothetical protein [Helicobacter sp. CPD2-1]MDL0081133.1 hypothetical protein [Helicobacter sp. XJK30-2]